MPLPAVEPAALTAREAEVANLVATGATNKQIATQLWIAPKTVATHVEHILTKLGASRRAEIAAWVGRDGRPSDPVGANRGPAGRRGTADG